MRTRNLSNQSLGGFKSREGRGVERYRSRRQSRAESERVGKRQETRARNALPAYAWPPAIFCSLSFSQSVSASTRLQLILLTLAHISHSAAPTSSQPFARLAWSVLLSRPLLLYRADLGLSCSRTDLVATWNFLEEGVGESLVHYSPPTSSFSLALDALTPSHPLCTRSHHDSSLGGNVLLQVYERELSSLSSKPEQRMLTRRKPSSARHRCSSTPSATTIAHRVG